MGKKKISVPTGEFRFKNPSILKIEGQIAPELLTEDIEVCEPGIFWPMVKKLTKALLMGVGIVSIVFIGVWRMGGIEIFGGCLLCPPPTPEASPELRYVVYYKLRVYKVPMVDDTGWPLDVLHYGELVEMAGQTHYFPNGKKWVRVSYKHVAGDEVEIRRGWVKIEGLR